MLPHAMKHKGELFLKSISHVSSVLSINDAAEGSQIGAVFLYMHLQVPNSSSERYKFTALQVRVPEALQ